MLFIYGQNYRAEVSSEKYLQFLVIFLVIVLADDISLLLLHFSLIASTFLSLKHNYLHS